MIDDVINIENLHKTYGSSKALDGFNLKVESNIIFGLLGPNGAGKTTAIEIMLGLKKQDSGSVSIFGVDTQKHYSKIADRVGVMLQQGGINPALKPHDALKLYAQFYSNPLDIEPLLERVDLTGVQTPVRRLSGGQAQSLSLALAIIGQPELVFLDEPTVGMDPNARRRTWEIIKELKANGSTVILTTHLMDEAELLCDRIAIVSKGKIVADGNLKELTQNGSNFLDVEIDKPIDIIKLSSALGVKVDQADGLSIRIHSEPTPELITKIASFLETNNVLMTKFSCLSKDLEEVFIELTAEGQ